MLQQPSKQYRARLEEKEHQARENFEAGQVSRSEQEYSRIDRTQLDKDLSEEQIFLMQIINGEIALYDHQTVMAELKQVLEL